MMLRKNTRSASRRWTLPLHPRYDTFVLTDCSGVDANSMWEFSNVNEPSETQLLPAQLFYPRRTHSINIFLPESQILDETLQTEEEDAERTRTIMDDELQNSL